MSPTRAKDLNRSFGFRLAIEADGEGNRPIGVAVHKAKEIGCSVTVAVEIDLTASGLHDQVNQTLTAGQAGDLFRSAYKREFHDERSNRRTPQEFFFSEVENRRAEQTGVGTFHFIFLFVLMFFCKNYNKIIEKVNSIENQ